MFWLSQPNLSGLELRLRTVERKLDLIMGALGLSEDAAADPLTADLRELVAQGRKLQAIKLYRERTGAGLLEAKMAVDNLS